ncbi:MAG: PD40 domain-containing protein [Ferruginibacter sp.]|nr:PD40 domain-containing protein [Ferruginibacter sp.]
MHQYLVAIAFSLFALKSEAQNNIQMFKKITTSITTEYKVGVTYGSSLYSNMEKFEFALNNGEKIELSAVNPIVYFSQKFTPGQTYSITQTSGPRACNLWSQNTGTITNSDVLISADCGTPPLTIFKLNVIGIEAGESFSFSDNYKRRLTLPFSTLANLGGFPSGDHYSITQTGGPRQCIITAATGTVPTSQLTIQCDCRKAVSPQTSTKLNGTFTAPSGTKVVLHLDNTDSLALTQPTNANSSWLQTKDFSFPKSYPWGTNYAVSIKSSPANLGCVVYENAEGTINDSIKIRVRCDKTYDLVSRSTDNKILNTYYESFNPVIGGSGEDEGRYVAFGAYGKGMDGSSGNYRQIFWRDKKTGETKLISKSAIGEEANQNCQMAAISSDGKSVAFESYATNLANNDNNGARDIFLWQQASGKVTLISKAQTGGTANSESMSPTISGNGNTIAYCSNATDIVKNPEGGVNIYVQDILSSSTTLISRDYENGKAVGGNVPSISDDGTKVAFCSFSYRLTQNDNNNLWDIFLWQKGVTNLKRISLTSAGGERNQGAESSSRVVSPAISGDGNFIAYATTATNMVDEDNNGMQDVFLYNTATSNVKRISTTNNNTDSNGDSPIGQGEKIGISYNGTWITYNTTASNLGVPKGNIVMQNTQTGKIIPITNITSGSTSRPMISTYGGYIIAGCSEKYDSRFSSSGIFTFHTGNSINNR